MTVGHTVVAERYLLMDGRYALTINRNIFNRILNWTTGRKAVSTIFPIVSLS